MNAPLRSGIQSIREPFRVAATASTLKRGREKLASPFRPRSGDSIAMSNGPTVGIWNGVIIWHTDEDGNFHWGDPADRLARLAWEEARLLQMGDEQRARREAIRVDTA